MSLLDRFLNSEKKEERGVFYSKMAMSMFGEQAPVKITLTGLPYKQISALMSKQFDKKGSIDFEKSMRVKALVVVEGVIDPERNDEKILKNVALMQHFDCATPADLAEKLFGMELIEMADEVCRLSGMVTDEDEAEEEDEEIKNS